MKTDFLDTVEFNGNQYYWRDVRKVIDDTEEHHYRVAELALENLCADNATNDFFMTNYAPSVYFAPLEILKRDDADIVEWCENQGMYFD